MGLAYKPEHAAPISLDRTPQELSCGRGDLKRQDGGGGTAHRNN